MTSHRLRRARIITLGIAVFVVAVPGGAQRGGAAKRPPWSVVYETNLGTEMTAAEKATAIATLREIQSVLERRPELAQPRGFEIGTQIFGGSLGYSGLFEYWLGLAVYSPSRAATAGEFGMCIQVHVNKEGGSYNGIKMDTDEERREHYIEQEIGELKPGATIVYEGLRWNTPDADDRSGYVIFTTGGRSPWIPVTREQFLRAQIYSIEGRDGATEGSVRKALEKTTYERWVEETATRKKQREEAIATIAQVQSRAAAEDLRKTLEQTEREVAAQLRAQDEEDRNQRTAALAHRPSDRIRARLASMTAEERSAPAAVLLTSELVPVGDPHSHRVLTPDREFWRKRRSRVEVHSIQLVFRANGSCSHPAVQKALAETYSALDWAALKRIVDRPW